MRASTRFTSLVAVQLVSMSLPLLAQDSDAIHKALKEIRETAADICYTVEQEGHRSDNELSGKVQAQLNGVISKLVELNVDGSGKFKNQEHKGVLQEQLAATLNHSEDCRKDVFDQLVKILLTPKVNKVKDRPAISPETDATRVRAFTFHTPRMNLSLGLENGFG
jgi:hypothetical protein